MSVKKTNLRFNLDKESDKKAYEYLQSLDKSSHKSANRFVISLINEYENKKHCERAEKDFTEKILSAIRNEMRAFEPLKLFQLLGLMQQPSPQEQNSTENENEMMNFLSNISGE